MTDRQNAVVVWIIVLAILVVAIGMMLVLKYGLQFYIEPYSGLHIDFGGLK